MRTLPLGGYGAPNPIHSLSVAAQTTVVAGIERGDAGPLLRASLPAGWESPSRDQVLAYNRRLGTEDLRARAAYLRALFSMPQVSEAALAANTVPTLAVVGDRDFMRPSVDGMGAVMSNLEVLVIPDVDHGAVLGVRFLREALAFLSAHRER